MYDTIFKSSRAKEHMYIVVSIWSCLLSFITTNYVMQEKLWYMHSISVKPMQPTTFGRAEEYMIVVFIWS